MWLQAPEIIAESWHCLGHSHDLDMSWHGPCLWSVGQHHFYCTGNQFSKLSRSPEKYSTIFFHSTSESIPMIYYHFLKIYFIHFRERESMCVGMWERGRRLESPSRLPTERGPQSKTPSHSTRDHDLSGKPGVGRSTNWATQAPVLPF